MAAAANKHIPTAAIRRCNGVPTLKAFLETESPNHGHVYYCPYYGYNQQPFCSGRHSLGSCIIARIIARRADSSCYDTGQRKWTTAQYGKYDTPCHISGRTLGWLGIRCMSVMRLHIRLLHVGLLRKGLEVRPRTAFLFWMLRLFALG